MCFLFFCLTLTLGVWVFISVWFQSDTGPVMLGLLVTGGILTIALSVVNLTLQQRLMASARSSSNARPKYSGWPAEANVEAHQTPGKMAIIKRTRWGLVAAGIFLIAVGTWDAPGVAGWNSLGAGIAVTLLGGLATQISPKPDTVSLFNREGNVLLEASQVEWKGSGIIIKGKILGSLTTNTYLKAEEAWKALSLVSPSVIIHLPLFFYRGWRSNRRKVSK
jgi:hypothetical protein